VEGGRETPRRLCELAAVTVPGFREKKRGKWPRDLLLPLLHAIDEMKERGTFTNDLAACKDYLKRERPELAKRINESELNAEAAQLQNRISNLRSGMKVAQAAAKTRLQ
jgi:hypothetical protein